MEAVDGRDDIRNGGKSSSLILVVKASMVARGCAERDAITFLSR